MTVLAALAKGCQNPLTPTLPPMIYIFFDGDATVQNSQRQDRTVLPTQLHPSYEKPHRVCAASIWPESIGMGGRIRRNVQFVPETKKQIAVYKRFRKLTDTWIDLAIEHAKLTLELAKMK